MTTENETFPWESQLIEIKSRVGWSIKAYAPLLQHRWKLFARRRENALKKLFNLPPNTISAILEHLYANSPIARTNLPAFKGCLIDTDASLSSSYHQDIMNLLNDKDCSDFSFFPNDSDEPMRLHRFVLYARSGFFRKQISSDSNFVEFHDKNISVKALPMFAEYLYTGELTITDPVAAIDLYGSGKFFEFRDQEEIDYLAMTEILKLANSENIAELKAKAEAKGFSKLLDQLNQISV